MPPVLIVIIFGLGVLVNLVALVWNLILCARQGIVWFLAVLLLPFANLVFLVKFWSEAKRPFFLSLAGIALIVAPVMMDPQAFAGSLGNRFPVPTTAGRTPPASPPTASETLQREQSAIADSERRQRVAQETRVAYDKHRAEADTLFKDLNTRRAKLKVDDAKAVAAFNADAARYAALLEQAKTERFALEPVTAVAVAVGGPVEMAAAGNGSRTPPAPAPSVAAVRKPVPVPAGSPSLPKRALDKARAARDSASAAEDAGPFAGEVYGTAPSSPRR